MTEKKSIKRSLAMSMLTLILCISMLIGTTLAWFTDSAESGINRIIAGNLDVELYHTNDNVTDERIDASTTNLFKDVRLWEPGAVAYETFTVKNEGTLALKYDFSLNVAAATVTPAGLSLADVLTAVVTDTAPVDRLEAIKAAEENTPVSLSDFVKSGGIEEEGETDTFTIIIYWKPTDNDNAFNMNNGNQAVELSIDLGIKLFATQMMAENDSFGDDYDKDAPTITVKVTPENVQDYLNGMYGALYNKRLVLTAGTYDTLVLAVPTKYTGSNTVYTCDTHGYSTDAAEDFKAHLADTTVYHTTPGYETSLENLIITAEDGVTVAGVAASSGHVYGDVYDYVLDKDYDDGSAYYSTVNLKNITFEGITFTAKSDINTSDADSIYDGISFINCDFTYAQSGASDSAAIRYYNESNNGNIKKLTVDGCTFNGWYQGIYTANINGITVTGSTFDTTGHNAIAIQSTVHGAVDHKNVIITNNNFRNIADRIIRFGDVKKGTSIVITDNYAVNSGDENGEVIKATTIEDGVTATVKYNSWGEGAIVVNDILKDTDKATFVTAESDLKAALAANDGKVSLASDVEISSTLNIASGVLDGRGYTVTKTDGFNNTNAIISTGSAASDNTSTAVIKNVVFDGVEGASTIRTLGTDVIIEACTFQNIKNDAGTQGIVRLNYGDAIVRNCKFIDNECLMAVCFNYDVYQANPSAATLTVENCLFENNSCTDTAVVYYASGSKCTVDGNSFVNNTVSNGGNGATIYLGFKLNCAVTNNLFSGNKTVSSGSGVRLSGGIMIGNTATITGNAFIGNATENSNGTAGLGGSVCASVYYADIELSDNYWGGGAPVNGVDYHTEYDNYKVIVDSFRTEYELDDDGIGIKG